jgi:adenine C2-methylase RlmN of 23S rRNA A2503 and tRNA A37
MEVYRTKDDQVAKYVHDDGSETTIKTVSSCDNVFNKITGKIEPVGIDRNKFSVFVSSSVGCPLRCKFCFLTVKDFPYYPLTPDQILNNFKEALSEEVKYKPQLRKMYMKLSWMGMGDAFLLNPEDLRSTTKHMIDWAISDSGYAFGLDGVDISTIMPDGCFGWPHNLASLNDYLTRRYRTNINNSRRSTVRLFYSLHSILRRKELIPNGSSAGVKSDLEYLADFRKWYGIDIILHYMFLEGFSDKIHKSPHMFYPTDLSKISNIIYYKFNNNVELRILRFNKCKNSPYEESHDFDDLVTMYAKGLPKVKYQISAGSEIKAACGQFLCLTNKEK